MLDEFKEIFNLDTSEQRYIFALSLIYKKFKATHCFIAKFVQLGEKAQTLCHFDNGKLAENFCYDLKNTPCEKTKNVNDVCCFSNHKAIQFPKNFKLNDSTITGYIGTTLTSFDQKPVGILVCLFDREFQCQQADQQWLLDFKSIIGSELNHQLKSQSIQQLLLQLEKGEQLAKSGTWQWDMQTNNVTCSKEIFRILELEYTKKTLCYSEISSLIHPSDIDKVKRQINTLIHEKSKNYNFTYRVVLASGSEKRLRLLGNVVYDQNNKLKYLNANVQDITDIYQLNKKLQLSNVVFDNASDAIAITDKNNNIISVNKSLEQVTGYSKQELLGKNPSIFSSNKHDTRFYQQMWRVLLEQGCWKNEIYNRRKNGEIYPEELSLNTVKNDQGEITNYIAIFHDITERKNTENKLSFFAHKEVLTGLSNRRYFIEQLGHHLSTSAKKSKSLSLLFIDINQFKTINDIYGHHIGDITLQIIAKRILNTVSRDDIVCCYGGDEFAVLLTNSNGKNAESVAHRIQKSLQNAYQINEISLDLSVSIGIAQYPDSGKDANALLRNATQAMANVRHEHLSGIGFYSDQLQIKYLKKLTLKEKLKFALKQNSLQVYYQPIVNANSEKIEKFEALVRWFDDEDGFISPSDFIPIAEEFGLIHLVGQFVLYQACDDLKKLHQLGHHRISFAINRSISEFTNKTNQSDVISDAIINAGLPFSAVTIEITESVAMSSNLLTSTVLANLKENGVKIALDDFCTGYSSLSNLIEYKADFLKIDKSFIDNILTDTNSQILTSTLIELAQKLDMKVIAEGVESKQQLDLLKQYNCQYIQGFFFSPAHPINDCIKMLAQQS